MTKLLRSITVVLAFCGALVLCSVACPAQARPAQMIAKEKSVLWDAVSKKNMSLLRTSLAAEYLDVSDVGVFTRTDTLAVIPELQIKDYELKDFKVIPLGKTAAIVT